MPINKEEKELLERIRQGDPNAIEDFIEKYRLFIYKEVRSLIRLGLISQYQKDSEWKNIIADFLSYIEHLDFIPDAFTIRQIFRLLIDQRILFLYLENRRFVLHSITPQKPIKPEDLEKTRTLMGKPHLLQAVPRSFLPLEQLRDIQVLYINGESRLTADYLSSVILPFVNAIAAMQRVCDEILNRQGTEVLIRRISYNSPINISLEGAADAIGAVKEELIPWRKENAKRLAAIQARKLEAEIKKNEAEALELRARSAKERADAEKTKAEAAKIREEAKRLQIENEKAEFELSTAKLKVALDIVQKLQPDLPEPQRLAYAVKLLPALSTLATSEIEITLLIP